MLKVKSSVCAAMLIAAGCAAVANAQPDVIVGELMDVSNYTTGGAIGGMHAYAVGTTSCNLGNQPLTWIDEGTSNQYPVISQNMYRLANGRFEQIGQAWLKHGFCALQGTVCSSCTPGGSCDALFPGCSDPYGSGLNGTQGGLGPKHVVNPATGFFPGDATSLIGTNVGDATLKARLQVLQSDITSTTALYFVSSTYIQPEDVLAGNVNNSQSFRRINIANGSGGNYAISLADSTHRQDPAIKAWQQYGGGTSGGTGVNDPTVVLTPVDVPGDGRFWVGSKVIDMGGGSYRYEYAVYNHNSNRGCSGFSVPLTGATTTSLYYFHDVPYHSGEIQVGTDWGLTASAGSVAWNYANDQAQDNRENVIRWDTIYNFSFVANAAPVTGAVTMNIFGAGSPSTMNATALVPGSGGGGGGAPFNDTCANALQISGGQYAFTNVNATSTGPNECTASNDSTIGADVWFKWTSGTCTNPMTISTCGSAYDTKLAVYEGATCPSTTSAIQCNDDTTGCTGGSANLGSSVTFSPLANTTYLIRVGGYTATVGGTTTQGTGTLTITEPNCAPQPPANNDCANAQWAAAGVTYTGSTSLASLDGTATCGSSTGPDVWYKYRPQTTGSVTLSTCGSNYDTVLSVHATCGTGEISGACNDDSSCASNGLNSLVTMNMTAGTTYLVRVSGYAGATGNYSLVITGGGGVVPPINDDCSARSGLAGTTAFSTVGATTDGVATPGCGQVFNEIWYNYPAGCTGTATVTAVGNAGFAPSLAIYNGGTCAATYLTCADAVGTTATATFAVTQGNSYAVRVGGNTNGSTGTGTISFSCTPSGPVCDSIDYNGDGLFPDTADIDDFLSVFSGGACSTGTCGDLDFNNDTLFPDTADIDSLLSVFSGGPCI